MASTEKAELSLWAALNVLAGLTIAMSRLNNGLLSERVFTLHLILL